MCVLISITCTARNPAYGMSDDAVRNPAYDLSDAVRNPAYDLSVRQAPNDAASVQSNDEDVYEDIPGTKGVHDSICLSLTLADHY